MEITALRDKLPHGAISEIAKRTKLSVYTISTCLAGRRKSPKETQIINAIADYLAELKTAGQEARQKLDAILNE